MGSVIGIVVGGSDNRSGVPLSVFIAEGDGLVQLSHDLLKKRLAFHRQRSIAVPGQGKAGDFLRPF